jgi:hypothetical protein
LTETLKKATIVAPDIGGTGNSDGEQGHVDPLRLFPPYSLQRDHIPLCVIIKLLSAVSFITPQHRGESEERTIPRSHHLGKPNFFLTPKLNRVYCISIRRQ